MQVIHRASLLAVMLGATAALSPLARAQSNPSSEQILERLDPTVRGLHGQSRGIHQNNSAIVEEEKRPVAGGATAQPGVVHARLAKAAEDPASVNLFVEFPSGSADLTPPTMAALDELGKALSNNKLATYRFRIEGHTDTVGTKEHNQTLSERRAAAVSEYLVRKFALGADRLVPVGVGAENLLVSTPPQTPEARNRRVQVINLGAS